MIFNSAFDKLILKGFNISVAKNEFRQRITDPEVTLNISRNHSEIRKG
jgi:hypothetical protein